MIFFPYFHVDTPILFYFCLQITGHSSDCVREYKKTEFALKRKISDVLSNVLEYNGSTKAEPGVVVKSGQSVVEPTFGDVEVLEKTLNRSNKKTLNINCGELNLNLTF